MEEGVFFFPDGTLVVHVFAAEFPELQCDNDIDINNELFVRLDNYSSIDDVGKKDEPALGAIDGGSGGRIETGKAALTHWACYGWRGLRGRVQVWLKFNGRVRTVWIWLGAAHVCLGPLLSCAVTQGA